MFEVQFFVFGLLKFWKKQFEKISTRKISTPKGGFPLDEFVHANRIFSSLSMCSFYITSLYAYVRNSLQRKKE